MKQAGKCVVWPENINSAKSRREGRKLPKDVCVDSPKIGELEIAARLLGLPFESAHNKARPGHWWEKSGYLLVDRSGRRKLQLLREMAREVAKLRQAKK